MNDLKPTAQYRVKRENSVKKGNETERRDFNNNSSYQTRASSNEALIKFLEKQRKRRG